MMINEDLAGEILKLSAEIKNENKGIEKYDPVSTLLWYCWTNKPGNNFLKSVMNFYRRKKYLTEKQLIVLVRITNELRLPIEVNTIEGIWSEA